MRCRSVASSRDDCNAGGNQRHPLYAPELAHSNADYLAEAYARLVDLEAGNFWFRARNRILTRIFRRYVPASRPARVLEIGCGTGFVLSAVRGENRYELIGAEQHLTGLVFAQRRLPDVRLCSSTRAHYPIDRSFMPSVRSMCSNTSTKMRKSWRACTRRCDLAVCS